MWSAFCFRLLSAVKLYLLGFKVLLAQLLNKPLRLPVMPRQDGRVAIVTGGGRGIGYEVVRHLARLGAHVIIGGRDEQEGLAAIQRICAEYKEAKVEFRKLDLASLQSVRQFAQSFKERNLPLNILVNNDSPSCPSSPIMDHRSQLPNRVQVQDIRLPAHGSSCSPAKSRPTASPISTAPLDSPSSSSTPPPGPVPGDDYSNLSPYFDHSSSQRFSANSSPAGARAPKTSNQ